jgi:Na+-transporting NADH:ubiquinone oxidoreductase subunit C
VKDAKGEVEKIILPIRGYGLWSTMRGFIALASDAETIEGFNLYDHAETPGLGGEVANPEWRKTWEGKKVINDSGEPAIQLVKGGVNASSPQAKYQVDSLSGATLTSKGVENLMHFWMGDNGFGPFLAKFKKGAA